MTPDGISLDSPSGSNRGIEGLLKGIGGVGVGVSAGEGAGEGGGVTVIFHFLWGLNSQCQKRKRCGF